MDKDMDENDEISSSVCNNDNSIISPSCNDDDSIINSSSSCNNIDSCPTFSHGEEIQEVTVRYSKESVLINFFTPNISNGFMPNVIQKIENHNLSMANYNAVPINDTTYYITIVAKKDPDFKMSQFAKEDFVNDLRRSICH